MNHVRGKTLPAEMEDCPALTAGRGGGQGKDAGLNLEHALLRARDLVDAALRQSGDGRPSRNVLIESLPGAHPLHTVALQVMPRAQREVLYVSSDTWRSGKDRMAAAREAFKGLTARGVRVRHLIADTDTVLSGADDFDRYLSTVIVPGVQVRVAAFMLHEVLIVDGATAFLQVNAGRADHQCVALRASGLLDSLSTLFTAAWDASCELAAYIHAREACFTETSVMILQCLSRGYTDSIAARELGLSVRTYRRHVAEIMRGLNAKSRFQAGTRAIEMGLVKQIAAMPLPALA